MHTLELPACTRRSRGTQAGACVSLLAGPHEALARVEQLLTISARCLQAATTHLHYCSLPALAFAPQVLPQRPNLTCQGPHTRFCVL